MDLSIGAPDLLAKVRELAGKVAETELVRDAYQHALEAANARIAELEAQLPQPEPETVAEPAAPDSDS